MTKRILHVVPTLDQGGAEKQLTLLTTGLNRDEFEPHVCALTRGGPYAAELAEAGVPVTVIGKRAKVDPFAYWRLTRFIKRLQPDLVHTWLFAANSYGRAAARQAGVKTLVAGERCVDRWKRWHEFAIDRCLARRTTRLATNSPGVMEFYVQHGLPREKFVIIPNGVPAAPLADEATASDDRRKLLGELQLPDDAVLLGAVGRLWPQKRVEDLIGAMELMATVRPDVHLLIIGDGPQRDRLERRRNNADLENNVHFLGHRNDVAQLLPRLACLWLASAYEGQPNSVLEAMAVGLPVVATDVPGNRDLVVPEETGFLVPVGDRAEIARRTLAIIENPGMAEELGRRARERAQSEFSVEKMVLRHETLYHQLLS
ncbi:MAG: glycosyltransferase [Planctomycetales bacterium]